MPYKDREKQRAYQRSWMKERREKWLEENGPCVRCGSNKELRVDHKDPVKKISHRIWSWSDERREVELKKCQVLCEPCHEAKRENGLEGSYKITRADVRRMRKLHKSRVSHRKLAGIFGVSYGHIGRVVRGEHWGYV